MSPTATATPAAEPTPQPGMIAGCVTYRPGDGAPIEIPAGPVEVTLAHDSATLSWDAGDGVAGLTAIPKIQFDDYVGKGLITLGATGATSK
ncbi:MAG: hypothetical protein WBK51_14525 [Polaromonas sp.]